MSWDIVGQDRAVRALKGALASGRPPHAYLFVGPVGTGKGKLAVLLAQAVNCTEPEPPCGECNQCRRIAGRLHADVQVVTLVPREEQRTRDISIDQVREVERSIALKAYEGKQRVIIIDPAEAMSVQAQNAFLKTLEEPPDDVVLVLLTCRDERLLPTIHSRCRRIEMGLPARPIIEQALRDRGVAPERANLLARLCGGRMGLAIRLSEDPALVEAREEALTTAKGLPDEAIRQRFRLAEKLAGLHFRDETTVAATLDCWRDWWRDLALIQAGSEEGVINIDRLPDLRREAQRFAQAEVLEFLHALNRTPLYLQQNINPRLAIEALLLQVPSPDGDVS